MAKTAEQEAREMLERAGIRDADMLSAGDLVELANIIHSVRCFTREDLELLDRCEASVGWRLEEEVRNLAARIEALLPRND